VPLLTGYAVPCLVAFKLTGSGTELLHLLCLRKLPAALDAVGDLLVVVATPILPHIAEMVLLRPLKPALDGAVLRARCLSNSLPQRLHSRMSGGSVLGLGSADGSGLVSTGSARGGDCTTGLSVVSFSASSDLMALSMTVLIFSTTTAVICFSTSLLTEEIICLTRSSITVVYYKSAILEESAEVPPWVCLGVGLGNGG
jgi:hypothetical protein